jgi:predicted kinase
MELILIRGFPGSGKSTLAHEFEKENYWHLETDMFFTIKGVYHYDRELIKIAHQWCQSMTAWYLNQDRNVVVSNTFIRRWEMEPYEELALTFGADLEVIVARGNYENTHNVPGNVIERMRATWED